MVCASGGLGAICRGTGLEARRPLMTASATDRFHPGDVQPDLKVVGAPAGPEPGEVVSATMGERVASLHRRRADLVRGDERATVRQRAQGKLTVRERLEIL